MLGTLETTLFSAAYVSTLPSFRIEPLYLDPCMFRTCGESLCSGRGARSRTKVPHGETFPGESGPLCSSRMPELEIDFQFTL